MFWGGSQCTCTPWKCIESRTFMKYLQLKVSANIGSSERMKEGIISLVLAHKGKQTFQGDSPLSESPHLPPVTDRIKSDAQIRSLTAQFPPALWKLKCYFWVNEIPVIDNCVTLFYCVLCVWMKAWLDSAIQKTFAILIFFCEWHNKDLELK